MSMDLFQLSAHLNLLETQLPCCEMHDEHVGYGYSESEINDSIRKIADVYLKNPQLLEQYKEKIPHVFALYQRSCRILESSDSSLTSLVTAIGRAIFVGINRLDDKEVKAFIHEVKLFEEAVLEALMLAAQENNQLVIKALLECDVDESPVVFRVARENDQMAIRALLNSGWMVKRTAAGEVVARTTALMLAAKNGHLVAVQALIGAEGDIERLNMDEHTALILAAQNGHAVVVRVLIKAGADFDRQTTNGATALMLAAFGRHVAVVGVLIEAGADIDRQDTNGYTALMIAAQNGNIDVVRALLGARADINRKSRADINRPFMEGLTAFSLAVQFGHIFVVRALIGSGVDINSQGQDINGSTPLMVAASNGYVGIVHALIDGGADIDRHTTNGTTALMLAADSGHLAVVKALIGAGADIYKQSPKGNTALMRATYCGHRATADLLWSVYNLSGEELMNLIAVAITDLASRKKALAWAKGVLCYYVHFKAVNELLVKDAVRTILWLEGNQNDLWYIHAHIRQKKADYPNPMQAIRPIQIRECGATIILNATGLIEGLHKAPPFREFKAKIQKINQTLWSTPLLDADVFKNLFTHLLHHLAEEVKKDPLNERVIKKEQEAKAAAKPFTVEGNQVFNLMKEPFGEDSAYVPLNVERLYAIAESLLREKDIRKGSDLLTPREDLMMAWLPLITNCATGQEEGISLCYHHLNVNQELIGQADAISEDEIIAKAQAKEAELYIMSIVQAVMESVVTSPKIFEELQVNKKALAQQVHLTNFLRNMTGSECGMNYEETFDQNAGWVPQELRSRSREEIGEVFFREVSKTLVSSLKDSFNSLESNLRKKIFNTFHAFACQHGIDEDEGSIWDISQENPRLTDFGAIILLEIARSTIDAVQLVGIKAERNVSTRYFQFIMQRGLSSSIWFHICSATNDAAMTPICPS